MRATGIAWVSSGVDMLTAKNRWFLAGLFLICMTTLMLQIIETRILSVVSMYYLAFISISMAMLGMTAGALLVYFRLGAVTTSTTAAWLSRISALYALAIVACYILQMASPPIMVPALTSIVVWAKVLCLLAAPFTVAGVVVSLALTRGPVPVGITYGVDLCGAAVGCLAVLGLLELVDASSAMFIVAALAAVAAWCFAQAEEEDTVPAEARWLDQPILRRPALVAVVLLAAGCINASVRNGLQPISAKLNAIEVGSQFDFERWNSFSRVVLTRPQQLGPELWGPSPLAPKEKQFEQRVLNIDGLAGTFMPRFDGRPETVDFLKYDITNLAYAARSSGRAAVIGVGSGRDILSAHLFGFRDITGVELNPIFIDLLKNPRLMRDYAGIADLPGVKLTVDEGRSWFARTSERFDLLQMSMIDTFAATGAGAFSLSENGLYTVEGWRIFLSTLTPTGMFTVSRWHSDKSPIEVGRTVSLAMAALMELGVTRPRDHIYLASIGNLATVIVSRQPMSAADTAMLDGASARLQFEVLARPGQSSPDKVFESLLSATSRADLDRRTSSYVLDLSAPTDARPFFFNQLRLFDWRILDVLFPASQQDAAEMGLGLVMSGNLTAMGTLLMLICLSALAVMQVIVVPARASVSSVAPALAKHGSIYFLLIGLGFMFVEIGLIQRISVFMGHPIYALSIVLFSIILSTGVGSILSDRYAPRTRNGVIGWLGVLALYVLSLPMWLPELLSGSLEQAGLAMRAMVSIAVVMPAGLLMGFGFPVGMRLVSAWDHRPTPWFWGINGAAGVLASGLAVAVSIGASIDATMAVGALCYLALIPSTLVLLAGEKGQSEVQPGAVRPVAA